MTLGWPQIIYAGLILFSMGIAAARYGQTKNDRYDLIDVLLGPAASFALLWWGGFWAGGTCP